MRNAAINQLDQIISLNLALGAKTGHIDIEFNEKNPGETSAAAGQGKANAKITTVKCEKLDDILKEIALNKISYIKLDVEGFEYEVLQGAKETILNNEDIIIQTELEEKHAARYGRTIK